MPRLAFEAVPRALDANGDPISYAKLRVYVAGTTTPVDTFSDVELTTVQSVPVIADSAGIFPEIYLPEGVYKVRIQTASGSLVQEADWIVSSASGLSFQTVAAMKASGILHAGAYVSTQGFYTPGDKGAANYLIVEDADFPGSPNGYSDHAITASTLVAKLVPDPIPTAAQFGADLTGTASAISAVSALIDYVNSRGGGVAFLPAGNYRWDGVLSKQALSGVILEGEGNRTRLIRYGNQTGAAIRFWGGDNNRIRQLQIGCQGYTGRGILLQDRFSGIEDCECLNCPDRPFAMNGGGDASYGLDSAGRNSDDAGFTTATFFPLGCWIDGCRVVNAGSTAFSQKRMRNSRISNCIANTVYSEGITADLCSYSVIDSNTLLDVALIDTSQWPDLVNGGLIAGVGGGGVGGIGIDNASGVRVTSNTIIGVHTNVATVNNRERAAINVVNNIGASYAAIITNNHIENAKCGVYLKGTGAGAAGNTFQSIIQQNTFKTIGTAAGTATFTRFGAVWLDALNNPNRVSGNTQIGSTIILTDDGSNNWFDSLAWVSFTPTVQIGGASTGITYGAQTGRYMRIGTRVVFDLKIILTAKGSLTGNLTIGGMPFPADTNAISITRDVVWICPGATAPSLPYAAANPSATTLALYSGAVGTSAATALTDVNLSATQTILISGAYEV